MQPKLTPEQYEQLTAMRAWAQAALASLHPDAVRVRQAVLHVLSATERELGLQRSVPCKAERRAFERAHLT